MKVLKVFGIGLLTYFLMAGFSFAKDYGPYSNYSESGGSPRFVTVDLTGVTDNNIPKMGASGFENSMMSDDGTTVTVTGALSAGSSSSLSTIYYVDIDSIPIGWAQNGTSAPDAAAAHDQTEYRTFASDADEDVLIEWQVPVNLYEATANQIKVRVKGVITNLTAPAADEGVAFQIAGCSYGDGDLITCAEGDTVVTEEDDLNGDAGANAQWDAWSTGWTVITITDLAPGETVRFLLNRDVSDTEDDYGQLIGVSWLQVKYYVKTATATY